MNLCMLSYLTKIWPRPLGVILFLCSELSEMAKTLIRNIIFNWGVGGCVDDSCANILAHVNGGKSVRVVHALKEALYFRFNNLCVFLFGYFVFYMINRHFQIKSRNCCLMFLNIEASKFFVYYREKQLDMFKMYYFGSEAIF